MPIVPLIAAGASIVSSILSRPKQNDQQKQATAAQTNLINNQSALAQQTTDFAKKQYSLAEPAYSKALGYYTNVSGAGGDAGLRQSLAPQYRQIGELYSGAQNALSAGTMRGATRDVQSAELNRQRVGQTADLTATARTNAMGQLGALGERGVSGATGAAGTAGNIAGGAASTASSMYGQGYQQQQIGMKNSQGMGSSLFSLFMPWLQGKYGGGSASTGSIPNYSGADGNYGPGY